MIAKGHLNLQRRVEGQIFALGQLFETQDTRPFLDSQDQVGDPLHHAFCEEKRRHEDDIAVRPIVFKNVGLEDLDRSIVKVFLAALSFESPCTLLTKLRKFLKVLNASADPQAWKNKGCSDQRTSGSAPKIVKDFVWLRLGKLYRGHEVLENDFAVDELLLAVQIFLVSLTVASRVRINAPIHSFEDFISDLQLSWHTVVARAFAHLYSESNRFLVITTIEDSNMNLFRLPEQPHPCTKDEINPIRPFRQLADRCDKLAHVGSSLGSPGRQARNSDRVEQVTTCWLELRLVQVIKVCGPHYIV